MNRSLPVVLLALLCASGTAEAKKKTNTDAVMPSSKGTSADKWFGSVKKDWFVRLEFDDDPSVYVGRFVKPGEPEITESSAMELACSKHITPKVVNVSSPTKEEYFTAASSVAANLSIPPAFSAGTAGDRSVTLLVSYTTTRKMQYEITDAEAFEACCLAGPNQCTDKFIGEFIMGTGQVYYSLGSEAEASAQGLSVTNAGDVKVKDGRYWRSAYTFSSPTYFLFRTSENIHVPPSMPSGRCDDPAVTWDDTLPTSTTGQYFVGVSQVMDSETAARDNALLKGKETAVRWAGESISSERKESTTYGGSGSGMGTTVGGGASTTSSASGVAAYVKDIAYCDMNAARPTGGYDYKYKVLVFLPKTALPAKP